MVWGHWVIRASCCCSSVRGIDAGVEELVLFCKPAPLLYHPHARCIVAVSAQLASLRPWLKMSIRTAEPPRGSSAGIRSARNGCSSPRIVVGGPGSARSRPPPIPTCPPTIRPAPSARETTGSVARTPPTPAPTGSPTTFPASVHTRPSPSRAMTSIAFVLRAELPRWSATTPTTAARWPISPSKRPPPWWPYGRSDRRHSPPVPRSPMC